MGRADQTAKVKGMFVRPEQIAEVAERHPRAVARAAGRQPRRRAGRHDADGGIAPLCDASLEQAVAETLQSVTKVRGTVKLVAPGSLPNDGKVIADERPVG